jgi:hypothetical protein
MKRLKDIVKIFISLLFSRQAIRSGVLQRERRIATHESIREWCSPRDARSDCSFFGFPSRVFRRRAGNVIRINCRQQQARD